MVSGFNSIIKQFQCTPSVPKIHEPLQRAVPESRFRNHYNIVVPECSSGTTYSGSTILPQIETHQFAKEGLKNGKLKICLKFI